MRRAAIYTRISEDPKSRGGRAVNVATQETDGRRLAAERGFEVVAVFTDNDLTAADPTVTRPGFEALLERALAGDFDAVIVYTQDRLVRLTADLERVLATFSVAGIELLPVVGTADLESPEGKLFARVNTLLGAYEVEKVRLRVRRKMADNAEKGVPPGGVAGFGFNPDKVSVNEAEAVLIKEAASRVLAGDALAAIVRDWNDRGELMRGRLWRPSSLRRVLLAPRTAGLRGHQGEIVGRLRGPAGETVPEILDRATWERVGKLLNRPSRRTAGSVDQKLLTGIALCSKCGEGLNHKWDAKGPRYFCRHCHGTLVASDHLEALVVAAVLEAVDRPALRDAVRREQEADGIADTVGQIAELEASLADLAHELGEGRLTMAEWKAARAGIEKRLRRLRADLEREEDGSALSAWVGRGGALREAWDDLSHGQRRAIIGAVFESLTILPAVRGKNRFDPERVKILWKV
jgi:site-specific DNA recombinase